MLQSFFTGKTDNFSMHFRTPSFFTFKRAQHIQSLLYDNPLFSTQCSHALFAIFYFILLHFSGWLQVIFRCSHKFSTLKAKKKCILRYVFMVRNKLLSEEERKSFINISNCKTNKTREIGKYEILCVYNNAEE